MKTTGVSNIPKFGLLVFLGHPNIGARYIIKISTSKFTNIDLNNVYQCNIYPLHVSIQGKLGSS